MDLGAMLNRSWILTNGNLQNLSKPAPEMLENVGIGTWANLKLDRTLEPKET